MNQHAKILVFTDIHIDVEPRQGRPDPQERLATGIAHAMAHQPDADVLVITGDLTHKGDAASYRRLRELLAPLTIPTHLLIGNHDDRATFLNAFPETQTDADGFVQQVVDLADVRLVMLDTLFGPPYDYPASHAGELCDKRLAWFETALTTTEKPCIVFMHHPPHETGFAAMDPIRLQNPASFYEIAHRAGNVMHIICGHIHRTISGTHRGVSFSMFKSLVGQMPMNFQTTDTQIEADEPPAYGILLINREGVVAHCEDFLLPSILC